MLCPLLTQCNHLWKWVSVSKVDVILGNPADSDISRQAQQQIINEMGTGMDIDSFLMEVNNLAPQRCND
jgi:hypothetical protein